MRNFVAITLFALSVVSCLQSSAAAPPIQACSLLTASDVADAVGGQAGTSQETDIVVPSGPSKGQTIAGCMWSVDHGNMVSVSVSPAPQGDQRQAAVAGLNRVIDGLKAKGWTQEKKAIPNASCSIMTPPASQTSAAIMTSCFGEAKGMGVAVYWMGKTGKVGIDPVKVLLDKVLGRLP